MLTYHSHFCIMLFCLFILFNLAIIITMLESKCMTKLVTTTTLKGYGNIFHFGLSIRTFGVIAISVVNFFVACSVSEILKDKRH